MQRGAIEAILCIKAINDGVIPPTINTTQVEPAFENAFNFVLEKSQRKTVNYAMNNTFGFGGHIASLIFKKYEE